MLTSQALLLAVNL